MTETQDNENDFFKTIQNNSVYNFDERYWIKKAIIIKHFLDNDDKTKEFLKDDKTNFLLFELYSTKIHCCETLLRIITVLKKGHFIPLLPLIRLKHKKLNENVESMKNDIDSYFENSDDFLKKTFYPFTNSEEEKVSTSIKFLKSAIQKIADEYSQRMAYNVFKHGFYGTVAKNAYIKIEGHEQPLGVAPNVVNWYEINPKDDHYLFSEKSHAISPEREFEIIKLCTEILKQLFNVKRTILKKESKITMMYFTDFDLNKIFSIYNFKTTLGKFDWNFKIELPEDFP